MKKKTILIPALAAVAVLASCGGTSSSSEVGSSETSSPAASSSPLGTPTVNDAIAALRAMSFDSLSGFTEIDRKYQYNFITLEVMENYRVTYEFDIYEDDVAAPLTYENLSGALTPTVINSFQGSFGLYDLADPYFASVLDYGKDNDLSTYSVYQSSDFYNKFDMVNNVDYYCDLIADTFEDPTTYFDTSLYSWDIEEVAITEVEAGYEVKLAASVPPEGYYAAENDHLAVVISKYDYSLVSLEVMTRTCNQDLTGDDEADTNLYQTVTLTDFVKGERAAHTPVVYDPANFPADNVSGRAQEVVDVEPGTLSEATVKEIMANQLAYIKGTKSSTITGSEALIDYTTWEEIPATVEATMTAYQDNILLVDATYTPTDGSAAVESTTLNYGTDEGIMINLEGSEPFLNPGEYLYFIGSVEQYLSASALFFNTGAYYLAQNVASIDSFGTVVGDYSTVTYTLHQATCSEDGIITIEISSTTTSEWGGTYSYAKWTIDNGFLSGLTVKSGESADVISTDLTAVCTKGELEEYPGIII